MASRKASAAQTALVDAGFRLTERTGLSGLSVNLVVAEAQVSKGSFFHHFGDRATYIAELHRDFHKRLLAETLDAIDGMSPGSRRLLTGANTYLDGCLRDRGVRSLLLEARAEPLITREVMVLNDANAAFCKLGWSRGRGCTP
jgi:TetR/AcrR family transcriptional regulator, transcriptional repressor for nem operon